MQSALASLLSGVLDADEIVSPQASSLYSCDIFSEVGERFFVIRPKSVASLRSAVSLITRTGFGIVPRGAGLSYSSGYLPDEHRSVILDTTHLTRIIEINADDLYVTVEPGVTWESLHRALSPLGLRTPYYGPFSGRFATVGATVSQNSVFFGSAAHGSAAESVLSLEILRPDGTVMATGSSASRFEATPFFRNYGPDLTGLFLSDCGAMGIKVKITLALLQVPPSTAYLSAGFATAESMLSAMSRIARTGIATECFGFDPFLLEARIASEGLKSDIGHLLRMSRAADRSLPGYTKLVHSVMKGRGDLRGSHWTIHLTVDGLTSAETDHRRSILAEMVESERGEVISDALPRLVRAKPFGPVNRILSADGERWVPMHAVVPHTRALGIMEATRAFLESNREVMQEHGIRAGYLFMISGRNSVVIEPTFFWPDAHYEIHKAYIEPERYLALPGHDSNVPARDAVSTIRRNLARLYAERGCAHLQIGRFYPYLESRTDEFSELLWSVKSMVDVGNRMNPGSLGMKRKAQDS